MRRMVFLFAALVLFVSFFTHTNAYAASETGQNWLDASKLSNGTVGVSYQVKDERFAKIVIAKGDEKYTYSLAPDRAVEWLPLQLGNGMYTIMVVENISGSKYKVLEKSTVELNLPDGKVVYMNSVQTVNWDKKSKAIEKAEELTKHASTDTEKVKAIYNYILNNIEYDFDLANHIPAEYVPQIDRTFSAKKDICYGYATLFAAMLRSVSVPTKLVVGQSDYVDTYHAWNEVYLDNKWVTIDTTVDAGYWKNKKPLPMIKEAAKYKAEKQY